MTTTLFGYPMHAAYGRVLPKSKIYARAKPGIRVKELFDRQVERLVWKYKLAPETINVPKTDTVPEIQVISIELSEDELDQEVLRCIDKAISFPLIFELLYEGKIKVVAAYKRPSEADSLKWVMSGYFETAWLTVSAARKPLPVVLNLEELYTDLLNQLMPFCNYPNERLQARVTRIEQALMKKREIEKCLVALDKEKQFSRKVEINAQLRTLKQELENLTCSLAATTS